MRGKRPNPKHIKKSGAGRFHSNPSAGNKKINAKTSVSDAFHAHDSKNDTAAGKETKTAAKKKREYVKTGISGLDGLFENGVPKGVSVLVAGGAGSGKTLMCLQMLANACSRGEKCLYMSFEESEERLREHMEDFGWNARGFEKKNLLLIKRFSLFDIARSIDALLEKAKGELLIEVKPVILPDGFRPKWVIVDSLTAISSAFSKKGDTYRSYIEQLFRYFEKMDVNSFFISETEEVPTIFSTTGVEEFLADGVIVLYNIRKGNSRESAIEVLKMRGTKHRKNIVAMRIVDGLGIEIYPEQEVFGDIEKS